MLIQQPALRMLAIVFLTVAMLGLGLEATPRGIAQALRDRRFLGRALLANLVVLPALGLGVAFFTPVAPQVKLGIALLALSPGAPFGLQFLRMVKGSEALAIGLALLFTALSFVYTPIVSALLLPLEAPFRLPYGHLLGALLLYLVLPLAAGLAMHARAPRLAGKLARPLFLLATVAFVTLMVLSGRLRRQGLQAIGGTGVAVMLALIAAAMLIGWWLGGPDASHRRVLAVSTSMRNVLVAELIATGASPSGDVSLPVLAFFALMVPSNFLLHLGLTLYHRWRPRHLPGPTGQPA